MTFRLGFVTGATPDKWAGTWRERQREPIELVPVTEDVQEHGVRTGALDAALVRLPVDRDGLHLIPLYEELPVAVLNVDNELTLLDEVTTEDLAGEHQDWTGLTVREAVETVAAGTGVLVVPMSVARLHHRKDVTHRTVTDLPSTTVGLAWLVENDDPRVQTFIGIVRGRSERSSRTCTERRLPMADSKVRAMTWNVWWRFGPRWRDRQPGIRATLERFRPDVVALQEVWAGDGTTQADELAEALGLHAVFASPSYPPAPQDPEEADWVGIDLGIAVLSRWPILDSETVVLPARHRSWDPVALTVRVDHPTGPLPIVAACLDYGVPYTDDRIAQGACLANLATDPGLDGACPVLLMGDLNAAVDSPVLRPVRDVLTDGWSAGQGAADAVTLPSTHPSAPLEAGPQMVDQRIDHIFFRAGREDQHVLVEGVQLAGEPVGGLHPSDHRAVVADLRWRG